MVSGTFIALHGLRLVVRGGRVNRHTHVEETVNIFTRRRIKNDQVIETSGFCSYTDRGIIQESMLHDIDDYVIDRCILRIVQLERVPCAMPASKEVASISAEAEIAIGLFVGPL